MGEDHVGNNIQISRDELNEIERILNAHTTSWCKIWGTGGAHGHEDRVISSKLTRSQNRAVLYLMYKDHKKEKGKTRPVVTGHTSNSRGLSNSVSNFLESVANCNKGGYESISDTDMLSKTKVQNKRVKEMVEKWNERRKEKIMKECNRCAIEEIISRCEMLKEKI